jgi:hypothetical protein
VEPGKDGSDNIVDDENPDPKIYLLNCMASDSSPDKAGPGCFSQLGLDYSSVQSCAEGEEGQRLHFQNGEEHNGLNPG